MTGEVVNLRRFRKRRERDGAAATAAANRAAFGQPAQAKALAKAEHDRDERHFAGHRRADADPADDA